MFELPKLPYQNDALEPHISPRTIEFHYGKHHAAYVKNLNALIVNTQFEKMSLEEIVRNSDGAIFNNAAQVWNHTFYWNCLTPASKAKTKPAGKLMKAIERDFSGFDDFKESFTKQSVSLFGSGWTWLVSDEKGSLSIVRTENAKNPLTMEHTTPLLCCDVWEHAYYLDYQNLRPNYLDGFWHVINWDFVEKNYSSCQE